jgi:uncharacterized protein YbgA (DUF1722 family)/uncharacterized protein YbbK (DUF523 family)
MDTLITHNSQPATRNSEPGTKIKLGVSSCLLGKKTRYDGGHKRDGFITGTWGQLLSLVSVCPEVECGLGVPREVMRLEGDAAAPRLFTIKTRKDLTGRMLNWTKARLAELEGEDLWGFIFKSGSPSCGPARVKVYDSQGRPRKQGQGLFAGAFEAAFPLLPVADEARLHHPRFRENFLVRVFTLGRWRELLAKDWTLADLLAFHTRHRLLLLAHSPKHYRLMGRLAAAAQEIPAPELAARYQALLLAAMQLQATPRKQANVLQHILGYFKKVLSAEEEQELLELIDSYRRGDLPLLGILTLLNHYVRKYGSTYLQKQYFLHPHPMELLLRFHA